MFQQVNLEGLSEPLARSISEATLLGSPQWLILWRALGATPLLFQTSAVSQPERRLQFSALRFGSSLLSRTQAHIDGLPGLALTPQTGGSANVVPTISNDVRDNVFSALRSVSGMYAHWVDYFDQFSGEELPSGWTTQRITTQRLALRRGYPKLADSVRRHIRAGQKGGAVLRNAESPADAGATFNLMKKAHERHKRSRAYPLELYENLLQLSLSEERIAWLVCEFDGKVIGAHIALYEGDTVISWAPYMDRDASQHKPAYLLLDKVIADACERGAAYVNLGVTPSGAAGVEQFKSRFGAENYKYNVFVYRSLLARALGRGALL